MASTANGDEDKSYQNRNDTASDDSADDFELVSESIVDASKEIVAASEYGSRGDVEEEQTVEDQDNNGPAIDPLVAFEMIQSEHRLLKDELEKQNEILHQRLEATENEDRRKSEEIAALKHELEAERQKSEEIEALKMRLDAVSLELKEKEAKETKMEEQIKMHMASSEKVDFLTAKLMETEELMKHAMKSRDEMIQQLQHKGVTFRPTASPATWAPDQALMEELQSKNETVTRMEGKLAQYESALGAMHGERLKVEQEARKLDEINQELRQLIDDLQDQAEEEKAKMNSEKAEWNIVHMKLQEQIQILSDRIIAYENQYNDASIDRPGSAAATADTQTLRHRDLERISLLMSEDFGFRDAVAQTRCTRFVDCKPASI